MWSSIHKASHIREALQAIGLPESQFAGHSFWIGAATTAGLEDSTIRTLGRWNSSAFLPYICTPREQLAMFSRALLALHTGHQKVKLTVTFQLVSFSCFFFFFAAKVICSVKIYTYTHTSLGQATSSEYAVQILLFREGTSSMWAMESVLTDKAQKTHSLEPQKAHFTSESVSVSSNYGRVLLCLVVWS